jgi:CelD/BcsL family acetyltransferase involved in cellulose biosynthesis
VHLAKTTPSASPSTSAAASAAGPAIAPGLVPERRRLRAELRPFDQISRETWDRLASQNPWATPFSAWAFHRAWWDAYGTDAHEETMVVVDPAPAGAGSEAGPGSDAASDPVAIIPLMHRHVVEARDAETHTSIRHGAPLDLTPVPPTAKAVYFGASYHADYATILVAPADLPDVAAALAEAMCAEGIENETHPAPWDAIDLRRLRSADPVGPALAKAFGAREIAEGWTLNFEREDVCPVATLPAGADIDAFLATLGKKERHEIRRKVRRVEAAGPLAFVESADPLADLEAFIEFHQAKWGADGLFPDTPGGAESRVMFRRMFELFGADGPLRLSFLTVDGRRIGASVYFETDDAILYYNAGLSPDARSLSPGVVMIERLIQRALETGRRRFDFMRGNEPYKYEWGAVDEPIQRLLVRRTVS